MSVARVLPNVTGLDKEFDYRVPEDLGELRVGDLVRVDLHGRRIGGWVVALDPTDALPIDDLKPIAKVTGRGPSSDLIDLAGWAAIRWAGRRRHFLHAASPDRAVATHPARATHRARRRTPLAGVDAPPRERWRRAPPPSDQRPAAGGDERGRARPDARRRPRRRPGDARGVGAAPGRASPSP